MTISMPPLLDAYRALLLLEIVLLMIAYSWAIAKYMFRARHLDTHPFLKGFRTGQAARLGGILLLLAIFAIAVVERFGSSNNGRLIFNFLLQIAILLFTYAWAKIDLPRFRAIPAAEVAHNILTAISHDAEERRQLTDEIKKIEIEEGHSAT